MPIAKFIVESVRNLVQQQPFVADWLITHLKVHNCESTFRQHRMSLEGEKNRPPPTILAGYAGGGSTQRY
jgi:hypothetical protein